MSIKHCLLNTAQAVRDGTLNMDNIYFTDKEIREMEKELKKLEVQFKTKKGRARLT